MEDLKIILSLSGTILGLLVTVLTFIVKTVRDAKAKRTVQQSIRVSNAVLPFIREAEKLATYSGDEKKAYVMTKANQFAINNNIPFNPTQVSNKIEELITLTRQVNFKPSSQEKSQISKEIKQVTQSNKSCWLHKENK